MDLLLMSALDLLGPSTAMPANKWDGRVQGRYADTGSDGGFRDNIAGYIYPGSVFVYLRQSRERSIQVWP